MSASLDHLLSVTVADKMRLRQPEGKPKPEPQHDFDETRNDKSIDKLFELTGQALRGYPYQDEDPRTF